MPTSFAQGTVHADGSAKEPPTASRPTHEGGAVILAFHPVARPKNRFTVRDRMEATRWMDEADAHDYTRLEFDNACETSGHEPGDYVLIYARRASWAAWGIASHENGLTLWNASTGLTIGCYPTMRQALQAVAPVAP